MANTLDLAARINLRGTSILVFDGNSQALDVMRQILHGFGVRALHLCDLADEARRIIAQKQLELIILDPLSANEDGFEFIRGIRRDETTDNRTAPIIAAIGHQTISNVRNARDAGANFVVAKPLSPEILLQRIEWVARENRQFIVAPNYAGPDRRFKNEGPPPGTDGRRVDDLPIDVPSAAEPNMGQNEIDAMFKPRKITL